MPIGVYERAPRTEEQKKNTSIAVKKYYAEHPEAIEQMRVQRKGRGWVGEKHPNWIPESEWEGLYPRYYREEQKEAIRERDGYICCECGRTHRQDEGKMPTHHIDYDKNNCEPMNLITMCINCHAATAGCSDEKKAVYRSRYTLIMQRRFPNGIE